MVEKFVGACNFKPKKMKPFDVREFELACEIDYRLAKRTVKERVFYARKLCDFLGKHPLRAERQELREFLTINKRSDAAVKTVRVLYGRFFNTSLATCFKVPQYHRHMIIAPPKEVVARAYAKLRRLDLKTAFLLFATSGLRRHELLELTPSNIDLDKRMIIPRGEDNQTKHTWITFFNVEARRALVKLLDHHRLKPDELIFTMRQDLITRNIREASNNALSPQRLRVWFCCEMGRLGVQDRFIDAFCGRVPRSVLGQSYTDYSPEKLKEIYDKAGLKVFEK
jgi:integrase